MRMSCVKNCGVVCLSVVALAASVAVFASQPSTGSDLSAASGMSLAKERTAVATTSNNDASTVIQMNDWQETSTRRRGSVRKL